MPDGFCGIGEVPKGQKRGTMKECAERGQVRYYGLKKIDKKLVEYASKDKKLRVGSKTNLNKKRMELILKDTDLAGKLKKLKSKFDLEKDTKEKNKLQKEINQIQKDMKENAKSIDTVQNQIKKMKRLSRDKKKTKSKGKSKAKTKSKSNTK